MVMQISVKLNDIEEAIVREAYALLSPLEASRTTMTDFVRNAVIQACRDEVAQAEMIEQMAEDMAGEVPAEAMED